MALPGIWNSPGTTSVANRLPEVSSNPWNSHNLLGV